MNNKKSTRQRLKLWIRRKKRARAKAGKKVKIRTMDIILVVVGVALLVFTIVMIRVYRETGAVPDTLVTCVFAALGGECGVMGWIKTTKERRQDRQWQIQDQKHQERLQKEEAEKGDTHESEGQ